jgi:hypothetical protein
MSKKWHSGQIIAYTLDRNPTPETNILFLILKIFYLHQAQISQ